MVHHRSVRNVVSLILLLLLFPALAGCGNIFTSRSAVGVLSAASADNPVSTGIGSIAREQNTGYEAAKADKGNHLTLDFVLENDPKNEIQVLVRNLAQDQQNPVVAILGGTSNDATMQIAGLVNFFNVPMIIPTADGNTLIPSSNLWAFRLSAPSSAYSGYLFNQLLNQTNLGALNSSSVSSARLSIAILYEQNTFGESAAVAAAEAAMAQGIAIAGYANFPVDGASVEQLSALADGARTQNASLLYIIASNPGTADALVGTLQSSYGASNMSVPIMLGQAGAFNSESFLGSQSAEGVYILRQRWNKADCPADLTSYYAAQSYGAAYLLNHAIGLTNETLATGRKWYTRTTEADELAKFRETLRDKLKTTSLSVPCIGNVAFDPTGQNKSFELEILTVKNGSETIVSFSDFLKLVIDNISGMNLSQ